MSLIEEAIANSKRGNRPHYFGEDEQNFFAVHFHDSWKEAFSIIFVTSVQFVSKWGNEDGPRMYQVIRVYDDSGNIQTFGQGVGTRYKTLKQATKRAIQLYNKNIKS